MIIEWLLYKKEGPWTVEQQSFIEIESYKAGNPLTDWLFGGNYVGPSLYM